MKKIISAFLLITVIIFGGCQSGGNSSGMNDYEKLAKVEEACKYVYSSGADSYYDDKGKWYIFELGVIYQKEGKVYSAFTEKLGDDFDYKLSNGDSIYVGFLPYRESYRIYAGGTDEEHTISPDWNYEALAEK